MSLTAALAEMTDEDEHASKSTRANDEPRDSVVSHDWDALPKATAKL